MTYKLEPWVKKIHSPLNLILPDGQKETFSSGKEAAGAVFDHRYIVESITLNSDHIDITLDEIQPPQEDSFF